MDDFRFGVEGVSIPSAKKYIVKATFTIVAENEEGIIELLSELETENTTCVLDSVEVEEA